MERCRVPVRFRERRHRHALAWILLIPLLSGCTVLTLSPPSERIPDRSDPLGGWGTFRSPGTHIRLSPLGGPEENALRMDYRLSRSGRYVVARKALRVSLPPNYEIRFAVKGVSPRNNLEFKLLDKYSNTFRKVWANHRFSNDWEYMIVPARHLRFGWGPNPGCSLREVASAEFAISAGDGGAGTVDIRDLTIRELPLKIAEQPVTARASSEEGPEYAAHRAVDGDLATRWRSRISDSEWLEIDLGLVTWVAGLDLYWGSFGAYDVLLSEDGASWRRVGSRDRPDGDLDQMFFEKTKARFVRVVGKRQVTREGYSLFEVCVKGPSEEVLWSASSSLSSEEAGKAMDGDVDGQWHSEGSGAEWLQVDLRDTRACGKLLIDWGADYAVDYGVEASLDGRTWSPIGAASHRAGGVEEVLLKEAEARFLRIACGKSGTGRGYAIRRIELEPPLEELTPTTFYQLAARAHSGVYPRWLSNEQAYWTMVGTPEDEQEALFCEDGTIEPHKRGFTIMPLLMLGDTLVTRDEARVDQALEKGYLPIPSVQWSHGGLFLNVRLFVQGVTQSTAYASYRVENTGQNAITGKLVLVLHPMQVYPPWQMGHDGFSRIRSISCSNGVVTLDGGREIFLLTPPAVFAAKGGTLRTGAPVEGDIADDVARGRLPSAERAEDPEGFASGAAVYPFELGPGESADVFLAVPLHDQAPGLRPGLDSSQIAQRYEDMLREAVDDWDARVNRVQIRIPDRAVLDTLKANTAYQLISKDGPGFQPGSRGYDKSWIRDGGSAAEALLKMGSAAEAREFINWFASYQLDDGEVPPIIAAKDKDPLWEGKQGLHEYDGQGEFVHLVLEYYRFTKDRALVEKQFPRVVKALQFLVHLREQRSTPEYRDGPPEKRIFYNILPASRSHEGYTLAHSYWDDFWGLRGWKDGKALAEILGKNDTAAWAHAEYEMLRKGVYDSIALVMSLNHLDYIPGCAEKGDFDPTSTAAAIAYCDELANMPHPGLEKTFDRYVRDISARLQPGARYVLTPYEIRCVPAFLRMGQKGRALELLRFLLACRRPPAWNQFAEVVHSDYRFPCYIGDMPHTWVGAEYIQAIRGLFLYEQGDVLVLGAGVDPAWLGEGEVISITDAPSYFGRVSCEMGRTADGVKVSVQGDAAPPGGFLLKSPLDLPVREIVKNGESSPEAAGNEVRFTTLPSEVIFRY
jgi:hypothetical protein